ncbi:hypothetical protein [Planomonospora sp. ID82291]|uniref:hypothetical protein n=1 Tax=Planomonospora sp. ID82291 TaxID=2738136 RepID=UPI0018C3EECA|nr:hypothetical protein [Planomonospora sp. ID82291]MBG0813772.1 hypothetical protein [Planomonospora sp. ID82291]
MTSPPGGGTSRRRPIAVPVTALVLSAALGVTAALGGFSDASNEPPKQLGPGAVVDQKQFLTKFVTTRTVFQPDEYGPGGKRFLEVELEVTNKGDETTGTGSPGPKGFFFAKGLLAMNPAIASDGGPIVNIADEGVPSRQLHPGMASTVVLRYELPEGQEPPEKVRFDVGTFEFQEQFTVSPGSWTLERDGEADDSPPKVVAQVTLPVEAPVEAPAERGEEG